MKKLDLNQMENIEASGWKDWEHLGCALAITGLAISFAGFVVVTGGAGLAAAGFIVSSAGTGLAC